jgi:hypothetical protein
MTDPAISDFAAIAALIVGKIDEINPDAEPNPWFSKDIFRKKDLQWAGYFGDIDGQPRAFAFGINLEFTPAWRRVFPKLKRHITVFSHLVSQLEGYEWHWMGRPGMIAKNPPIKYFSRLRTSQVDFTGWITELENILDRKVMWSASVPMRPQIQVMRNVGSPDQLRDTSMFRQNIEKAVKDLRPLVAFFE